MSIKLINMEKKVSMVLAVSIAVILASCGNSAKDQKGDLGDKKTELAKLKKEKTDLDAKIQKLEADIAKADPNSAAAQKLVSVAPVTRQDFVHYIDLRGNVDADKISNVVPGGNGGIVKAIYVTNGQTVSKGKLLVKLDDAIPRQQLAAAQQQISGVEAQYKLNQSVYERQQNLWKEHIGTEVQVLQAKTQAEGALSQLNAARANVKALQEALDLTNVYADISGTIDALNLKVGDFFNAQAAMQARLPMLRIVNTSSLKVNVKVPENYTERVKLGAPVKIVLPDLNNKVVEGKVSVAGKFIDPLNRSFDVEAKLPFDKDIHANQAAVVRIEDYKTADVVTVPINVVQNDETGKYLFITETANGKLVARKRVVIVGEAYNGQIEIKSGLQGGEQVITEGYQTVYDGQAIAIAK